MPPNYCKHGHHIHVVLTVTRWASVPTKLAISLRQPALQYKKLQSNYFCVDIPIPLSAKIPPTDIYCIKLPIIMGANKALYPSSSPSLITNIKLSHLYVRILQKKKKKKHS